MLKKMNIEKYKAELEAAIYEGPIGGFHIGGKVVEKVFSEVIRESQGKITKKLSDLYVVVKTDNLLYTDGVYDFRTAESVCSIARDCGYNDAEVITLQYALSHGCVF